MDANQQQPDDLESRFAQLSPSNQGTGDDLESRFQALANPIQMERTSANGITSTISVGSAEEAENVRRQGYYPTLNEQQKAALKADSIQPSVSGNLGIMAAPLAVPEAASSALQKMIPESVGAGVEAVGQRAAQVAREFVQNHPEMVKLALNSAKNVAKGAAWASGGEAAHKFLKYLGWSSW
jgi:hypothetical protein